MAKTRSALLGCFIAALGLALAPAAQGGWWRFEGTAGTNAATVPNAENPGTLDGTGDALATFSALVPNKWVTDPVLGVSSGNTSSLAMGAGQGLVTVLDDAILDAATSFTVEAFVRQGTSPVAGWSSYISRRYDAGAGSYRGWQLDKNNTVPNPAGRARVDTSSAQNQVVQTGTLTSGTWAHTALTYNAANGLLAYYVNYTSVATATLSGYPGTSSQLSNIAANLVMGSASADWGTNAAVDEVRFTPQVLAPSQFLLAGGMPVSYRITGAAPTTGTATITGYLNDSGVYNQLGTEFRAATAGTPFVTATGTVGVPVGIPSYLQLKGAWNGTGTPDQTSAPYIAATFTAPAGYIFSETGNQYVSTDDTNWAAHSVAYGGIGWPGDTNLYALPSPSPTLASQGHPTAPAVAPQALWQISSLTFEPTTTFYLDRQVTLTPGTWSVFGPEAGPFVNQGLSAQIVRVNSNLDNLGQVDTALTRVPNGTDHSVSQVTTITKASLDGPGFFANTAGYFPGAQDVATAGPEDYAVKLAGYIYATAGSARSFAISGDDRFYFTVGGAEFIRANASVAAGTPTIATMQFDATGYYPIQLVYGNRGTLANLEISTAAPTQPGGPGTEWIAPAFDAINYQLLGTDAGYPVYQNPSAMPATFGANAVAGITFAGAVSGTSDGLRVQQAYPVSHGGVAPTTVDNSITFFADKVIQNGNMANYNIGVATDGTPLNPHRSYLAMTDPQGAGAGNWTGAGSQPFPIDNRDASYNLVAAKADDNFVTRINGLLYIEAPGTYAVTNSTDDAYQLRIGNQQFGRRPASGGTTAGTANFMYGYFPTAGLYPFEYYHYEGTGGSNIELAHVTSGATQQSANLILATSRNPAHASNGFTPDWTTGGTQVYSVVPTAMLRMNGTTLQAQAYGAVPALATVPLDAGKLGVVAPEHWTLQTISTGGGARVAGLLGTYYDFANNQTVDNTWPPTAAPPVPVLGTRTDIAAGTFAVANNFASAFVTSRPGSPVNPAPANDYFGVAWTGYLNVPTTGLYTLQCLNDDRGWMFIDVDGNGTIDYNTEGMPGQPQQWSNWMAWSNVYLDAGLHAIDFRTREWSGGEPAQFQWSGPGITMQNIAAAYLSQNIYDGAPVPGLYLTGTGSIGDLLDYQDMHTFDFNSTYTLRLSVDIAGLTAIYQDTFTFVPEPGTMLVLAGGLLALTRRRRRNRA